MDAGSVDVVDGEATYRDYPRGERPNDDLLATHVRLGLVALDDLYRRKVREMATQVRRELHGRRSV